MWTETFCVSLDCHNTNTYLCAHAQPVTYLTARRRQGWRRAEAPSLSCCRPTPGRSSASPGRTENTGVSAAAPSSPALTRSGAANLCVNSAAGPTTKQLHDSCEDKLVTRRRCSSCNQTLQLSDEQLTFVLSASAECAQKVTGSIAVQRH